MAETPAAPKRYITLLTLIVLVVGVVVLAVLLYIGGNFALPAIIKTNYQSKNCELVLSLNNTYTSIYPAVMVDQSIPAQVKECALYLVAGDDEKQQSWQDAYNAYKSYADLYPAGLFSVEARNHSAAVLLGWSKALLAQKKYQEAVGKLEQLSKDYANTPADAETAAQMTQTYIAWAVGLRDSSDFAGAEATIKAFEGWAQNAKLGEATKSAQHELAQTYLSWGLALQAQKQFDDAKAKLDLAISADPQPLATDGPAAQAKAAQVKLYTEWGDDFLGKKDFTNAINRYQAAIPLALPQDQPAAKDVVANAYLAWAASLRGSEDFLGALQQIEAARKNTGSAAGTKSVDTANSDTYLAFSKSSGTQAVKAMKDAIKAVCAGTKPDLPIFGLDQHNILAAASGIDHPLPDNVLAKTPGTLHYVACIDPEAVQVEKKDIPVWTGSGFATGKMVREKEVWHVSLVRVTDATLVQKADFEGGPPPAMPSLVRSNFISIVTGGMYQRYKGTDPDAVQLANWMLGIMK